MNNDEYGYDDAGAMILGISMHLSSQADPYDRLGDTLTRSYGRGISLVLRPLLRLTHFTSSGKFK